MLGPVPGPPLLRQPPHSLGQKHALLVLDHSQSVRAAGTLACAAAAGWRPLLPPTAVSSGSAVACPVLACCPGRLPLHPMPHFGSTSDIRYRVAALLSAAGLMSGWDEHDACQAVPHVASCHRFTLKTGWVPALLPAQLLWQVATRHPAMQQARQHLLSQYDRRCFVSKSMQTRPQLPLCVTSPQDLRAARTRQGRPPGLSARKVQLQHKKPSWLQ
jgi:hypothetical protein